MLAELLGEISVRIRSRFSTFATKRGALVPLPFEEVQWVLPLYARMPAELVVVDKIPIDLFGHRCFSDFRRETFLLNRTVKVLNVGVVVAFSDATMAKRDTLRFQLVVEPFAKFAAVVRLKHLYRYTKIVLSA